MATGALDANGIWQYGEDDSETTFSGLLNKLASSTSDTVTRLEGFTGYTGTLPIANGGTGATVSRTILQVVTDMTTTEVANASISYVTTGLSVTFTPKRSDSTILIFYSLNGIRKIGDSATRAEVQLWRDSSVAQYSIAALGLEIPSNAFMSASAIHEETSGSTSARTYDVRFARTGTGTMYMQYQPGTTSTMTIFEVAA